MRLIQIDRQVKKESQLEIGQFSQPSKLPCYSWSIPATKCHTGSKLAKIPGSVCAGCYALKGFYRMPRAKKAMDRRLKAYRSKNFVKNFVLALQGEKFFRWFDSGDVQNLKMLEDIADIAKRTPDCNHWLPTKESGIVKAFLAKHKTFPSNLVVRISAYMVNQVEHSKLTGNGSIVVSDFDLVPRGTVTCNAPKQGGKCLDCRACWNKEVPTVAYLEH